MSDTPIKNAIETVVADWRMHPFKRDRVLHFMMAPPAVDVDFITNASDDFLRLGLHRMGQHLEPFNQGAQTTICPFSHKNMRDIHYEFLRQSPHKLGFLKSKISWNRDSELLILDYAEGHSGEWLCYLPECRSCTENLYRFLFPIMVYQQWINALTAHIHMLTTETLRQLETLP